MNHTKEDYELMLKFYREENSKLRRNLETRDDFLVERGLFSEFTDWLKKVFPDGKR